MKGGGAGDDMRWEYLYLSWILGWIGEFGVPNVSP